MTDAQTDAQDEAREQLALDNLKDFSPKIALEITKYMYKVRARHEEPVLDTMLEQIAYYIQNKDLDDLIFKIQGTYACGATIFAEKGFEAYIEHAESCDKCRESLSRPLTGEGLTPEDISDILENKIKANAPDVDRTRLY